MSRMKDVKAALQGQVESLVRELVPEGRRAGQIWSAKNPCRADRRAGSFVVWLRGEAAGAWKDYATGEGGDLIDLVCLANGLDRKEALAWAEDRLGWRRLSADERRSLTREVLKRQSETREDDEHRRHVRIDRARRWYASARPIAGTLGEAYFSWRGVPLDSIKHRHDFCRFLPSQEWWFGAEYEDGRKVRSGPRFPAIVSKMVDAHGRLQALHFTFLALDGRGKAPVPDSGKAKLMWPETAGAAIWLTRGRGNRKPKIMIEQGMSAPAVVGEGIEDGLSSALANPDERHMAAGSLPNLLHLPDYPWVNGWIVLKDNDWGKPQAQALFDRAAARLGATGKPVFPVSSLAGKDFNEQLQE